MDLAFRWVRALRLPFLGASVLPYLAGVSWAEPGLRPGMGAGLGLAAVAGVHLCANLVNDVADTDAGADATDPVHYGFFGGSKVIQDGELSRGAVLRGAGCCGALACGALLALAALRDSALPLLAGGAALLLALAYSRPPLRLVARGWGELVVALLFGPVTVLAGYYARSGGVPGPGVLRLGVVAGLLTMGVLVANEVPDAVEDAASGKRTLVVRLGVDRGWLLYAAILGTALGLLPGLGRPGRMPSLALTMLAGLLPAAGAASRLRKFACGKRFLVTASVQAMMAQAGVLGILLLDRQL